MTAIFWRHSCFVCLCSASGTCESASPRSGRLLQVAHCLAKFCGFWEKDEAEDANGKSFLVYFLWIVFLVQSYLVDAVEGVQHCTRSPIWGHCAHFFWSLQPHGWGYLRLCFQPGEQQVVKKITLEAQPQRNLWWFWFGEFGTCLWGRGCPWIRWLCSTPPSNDSTPELCCRLCMLEK